MEDKDHLIKTEESSASTLHNQDVATILSQLPGGGAEDDVMRFMDLYEAGERTYRASVRASSPTISSSATTSL